MSQGGSGVLRTSHSGTAQSLYQLQMGVTTLFDILTRFGAGGGTIANGAYTVSKFDRVIEKVDKLLGIPECASAVESFTPGKLLTKCFSPELVLRFFGTWAVFIAPAMAVGPLVEFFRSELNTLGDQLNGRSKYGIVIQRGKTLKFHNLTIPLQSAWINKPIAGGGEGLDSKNIRTGSCHNDLQRLKWCQGFYVFGPNGGKVGNPPVSYEPPYPWEPYTDVKACPMYADRGRAGYADPSEAHLHEGTAKIGTRTVRYNEWKIGCLAMDGSDNGNPAKFFVQKVWYDPQSKIFIVDEWGTKGLPEALANAQWN